MIGPVLFSAFGLAATASDPDPAGEVGEDNESGGLSVPQATTHSATDPDPRGIGYIRGIKSQRICRKTKVLSVGGGAEEILKELGPQLEWLA